MVRRGEIPWNKGKPWPDEVKAKISIGNRKPKPRLRPLSKEFYENVSRKLTGIIRSPETRGKIARARRGTHPSEATRKKLALAGKRRVISPEHSEKMKAGWREWAGKWPKPETKLETRLYALLNRSGYAYQKQKQFGSRIVDAYVPELNLAFEADGAYWHKDKKAQLIRDEYLISKGIEAVVHLTEIDLKGVTL